MADISRENKRPKKRGIGDVISTMLLIVALAVFIYAAVRLITIYFAYKTGVDEYKKLSEYVTPMQNDGETEPITDPKDSMDAEPGEGEPIYRTMENPVDFESLCGINEDVIGWLEMESVSISYPLVQGKDNDYYLHRTFQRTDNFAGSIFMDCLNNRNFTDENSILYGHNMNNGSMFGILRQYRDSEKLKESPYFWIYTPDYLYKYEIFACAEVSKTGKAYQISFNTEEDFQEYIYLMQDQALYQTGVDVTTKDKIVTLSTCTGNEETRFIVQGKRVAIYRAVPKADGYQQEEKASEE